jgi:pimeloyl-ACP methyl ester carboxylesterase
VLGTLLLLGCRPDTAAKPVQTSPVATVDLQADTAERIRALGSRAALVFVVDPREEDWARAREQVLAVRDEVATNLAIPELDDPLRGTLRALGIPFDATGLDLFVATYRGYGASDGTPTFAALVADVHPIAARFHQILDSEGGPGLRLVMGRSLGGHAALEVAAHCPERFDALVLSSPAGEGSRLADRLVDVPEPTVRALLAAHEAKLAKITLPTLLVHGSSDDLIPLSSVERLAKLLTSAAECTMMIIDGASHNDLLWLAHDAYFEAIGELVERCRSRG